MGEMTIRADHSIRQLAVCQDRLAILTCHEATSAGDREVLLMLLENIEPAVAQMREVAAPLPVEAWPWKTAQMISKVAEMGFGLAMDMDRIVVSMEDLKIWTCEPGMLLQNKREESQAGPEGEGPPTEGLSVESAHKYKSLVRERPPPKRDDLPRKVKMITGSMVAVQLWGARLFTVDYRGILEEWDFGS